MHGPSKINMFQSVINEQLTDMYDYYHAPGIIKQYIEMCEYCYTVLFVQQYTEMCEQWHTVLFVIIHH